MKKLLFIVISILFISTISSAQSSDFKKVVAKTKQSYIDRGYKLVVHKSDSIISGSPLVTPQINFNYKTYYVVVVQLDGCFYCDYDLQFVDEKDYLFELDTKFEIENNLKQCIYKFENPENITGKYVVFLKSEMYYYANIFVFKR